ncbi:maleylpyruvate isomerase family mycothiol-dependent enzyme [Nocardia mexicana]|uniref:Maleylpyruvate isomerase n=1 Tax=Nocardia mexicana TaxID=279262 RepID=A0A370HGP9_9NOCA|nr:maleylpyruvate isomerase family mycothiol-dependent enzyme [Nocardia mexicana]RDI55940.1 maleylpyruvate isomerase [Nocardia mexicana]
MTETRPETALDWMLGGTAVLLDIVDRLPDHQLGLDSSLPGWTRRHVLAHLTGNARALGRLADWAATGDPNPMYPSPEARDEEISSRAGEPADRLRQDLRDTAAGLERRLRALTPQQWRRPVVTAQGRTVAATEIPWLRSREVWVHAVDLAAGVSFADVPAPVLERLVADVIAYRAQRGTDPLFAVEFENGRRWPADHSAPVIAGSMPDLAAWLTGRGPAPDPAAPSLSRWL